MKLFEFAREREWVPITGYLIYVSALTAGYYYNLTFVQLGLTDLGTQKIGMPPGDVSIVMAILALLTLVAAVVSGVLMDRRGWSTDLYVKFRLLFLIVLTQLILTVAAPHVSTIELFVLWVIVCSIALGVGIPVSFSFMLDFVPVRDRGYVAAVVAGLSFFVAALYPIEWRIDEFSLVMSAMMVPAVLVLAILSVKRFRFVDTLASQHERDAFGTGRFCRPISVRTASFAFWGPVLLMFGVFFIDSLGFLRIIETTLYIYTSWQSPDLSVRLFIAVLHVVGALAAGVIYTNFDRNWLFLWVFGLFAFTHLLYVFHIQFGAGDTPPLVLPMFYVLAVSFYTTLNFALWPDLSTPETIGTHTALGVGIAGWLATFLSTSLALYSEGIGLSLLSHLTYVNALALLFVVTLPVLLYVHRMVELARGGLTP
ncbi:MFS transporter [Natrinema halophilum]|uniref:MFS transporter n=1 Tax=Natrinema halophilum TaxID=1699371 RepID=A0A7D5GJH1_9EURY|nr:MFS transporter [Natrinema halophilum]QLG50614.1 MFS transporter [Natrinema halophilum]